MTFKVTKPKKDNICVCKFIDIEYCYLQNVEYATLGENQYNVGIRHLHTITIRWVDGCSPQLGLLYYNSSEIRGGGETKQQERKEHNILACMLYDDMQGIHNIMLTR